MSKRKRGMITAFLGLLLIAAVGAWLYVDFSGDVAAGVLEASGRVEGDQAAVGAKIGGQVVRMPVREGSRLEAGEIIAELASAQAEARLEEADHGLHNAREQLRQAQSRIAALKSEVEASGTAVLLAERESGARIAEAEAALGTARAALLRARAERVRAERDYSRYRELYARDAVAQQELDHARAAFEAAGADEEAARKKIAQAEESLELARTTELVVTLRKKEAERVEERLKEAQAAAEAARAQVQSAEARRAIAVANLKDTRVLAPFSGTVLRKLVEVGEVVAAGTPLITLVDPAKLYARVYVAQGELGKIKIDEPARVYTDAFPKRYFEATVSEVSERAEFTPRDIHMKDERVNLVFAVRLAIKNPEGVLKPGMPVDARVRWAPESAWGDGLE